MKVKMAQVSSTEYRSLSGMTMRREYGKTPNGNELGGRWVLRDADGTMLTFDQYSNDIAEEFNLDLGYGER